MITKLSLKLTLSVIVLAFSTACTSAPVQEMSDARIAIQSAEDAGAKRYSATQLNQAKQLLQQATVKLQAGAYDDARRFAQGARDIAIRAREKASAEIDTVRY